MRAIIEPPPDPAAPLAPLWKRLGWFAALSVGAALATAAAAYALRALLR
ncbi:MAG: hypothetical protein ACHP9T_07225 [Caulobacterales bacterium]|jgi:uncharacterized protein involved in exopolysaccharide biosynthesis